MRDTIEITVEDGESHHELVITKMTATQTQKFLKLVAPTIGKALGTVSVSMRDKKTVAHCDAISIEGDQSVKIDFKILAEALGELDESTFDRILDMLYSCVQRRVGGALVKVTSGTVDASFSSVQALQKMQMAALTHNFGFFTVDALSKLASASKAENSFNMRTSRQK